MLYYFIDSPGSGHNLKLKHIISDPHKVKVVGVHVLAVWKIKNPVLL